MSSSSFSTVRSPSSVSLPLPISSRTHGSSTSAASYATVPMGYTFPSNVKPVECYCQTSWENCVYSPSPWISKHLVDKLITDNLSRAMKTKQRLQSTTTTKTPTTPDTANSNNSNAAMVKRSTNHKRGRSSMIPSDEDNDKDNANESSIDVPRNPDTEDTPETNGEEEEEVEENESASATLDNATFYTQLVEAFLQPVSDEQLQALPSTCCRESIINIGQHYRLKDRIDLSPYPLLRETLLLRHRNLFLQNNDFDFENILHFFEYQGGESGKVMLCTIHDPLHPLSQVAGAGNVSGTFAREPIKIHEILGMYPGVLMPMAPLEKWMANLTVEERRKSWMYDLTSSVTEYSYHGMGVRNVLAGINDYHGIDPHGASVKKVSVKIGGIIPIVFFVAARDIQPGEELTLKYGEAWVSTFMKYFPSSNVAGIFQNSTKREVSEPRMIDILASITLGLKERTRHGRKTVGNDEVLNRVALANASPSRNSNKGKNGKNNGKGNTTDTKGISVANEKDQSIVSMSALSATEKAPWPTIRLPTLSLKVKINQDQLDQLWDYNLLPSFSSSSSTFPNPSSNSSSTMTYSVHSHGSSNNGNGTIVTPTHASSTKASPTSSSSSSSSSTHTIKPCITPRSMCIIGSTYHSGMGIGIDNCAHKQLPNHSIFWERQQIWENAARSVMEHFVNQNQSSSVGEEIKENNAENTTGKRGKGRTYKAKIPVECNDRNEDNESISSDGTVSSVEKLRKGQAEATTATTTRRGRPKKTKNNEDDDADEMNEYQNDVKDFATKGKRGKTNERNTETEPKQRKRRARKTEGTKTTTENNEEDDNDDDDDEEEEEEEEEIDPKAELPSYKPLPSLPREASALFIQINLLWKAYLTSGTNVTITASVPNETVLSSSSSSSRKKKPTATPVDERVQIILNLLANDTDFTTIDSTVSDEDRIAAWVAHQSLLTTQYQQTVKERQETKEYNENVRRMHTEASRDPPPLPKDGSDNPMHDDSAIATTEATSTTENLSTKSSSKWKNTKWYWEDEDRLEQQVQSNNHIPTELEILTAMFLPLSQRTRHAKKAAITAGENSNETTRSNGNEKSTSTADKPKRKKREPQPANEKEDVDDDKKEASDVKETNGRASKKARKEERRGNSDDKDDTPKPRPSQSTAKSKTKKSYWVYVSESEDEEEEGKGTNEDPTTNQTNTNITALSSSSKPSSFDKEIQRITNDTSLSRTQRKQLIDLLKQDYQTMSMNNSNTDISTSSTNNGEVDRTTEVQTTTSTSSNDTLSVASATSTLPIKATSTSTISVSTVGSSIVTHPTVATSALTTLSANNNHSSLSLSSSSSSPTVTSTTAAPIKPDLAAAIAARNALMKLR